MIAFLRGVPGKLKTISDYLTTYWTAARAAKVDNLDAAISSRAAASTAVSTADYTPARAIKLDGIGASVIKSVQTGFVINVSSSGGNFGFYEDVTVSAVTIAKCLVIVELAESSYAITGYLTSPTNIRLESSVSQAGGRWKILEFV